MDYEKAYKAVLKTAQQWIKDGCSDKERICLECVFPELRESEDERIRRGIIQTLEFACAHKLVGVDDVLKMKAYLEKQKEQKEIPLMGGDADTYFDDLRMITTKPLTSREWFNEGIKYAQRTKKEQKPTCWQSPIMTHEMIMDEQKEPHYTKRNALFDKCVENCDPKTVEEVNKRVDDIMNMPELSAFEQALTNFIGYWEDDEERWPSKFVKKHGKHILDMAREELQKEQKPAQHLPKEKVFDIMRNLTALSYSERIPINSDEYGWIHKITEDVRSLLDYPVEQKPAQTDDEKEYTRTIKSIIADFIRDKKPEDVAYYQRIYDWIDGRHVEQKPTEWSDTNELVFKDICKHLKEEGYNGWVTLLEALHSGEFKQPVAEWSEDIKQTTQNTHPEEYPSSPAECISPREYGLFKQLQQDCIETIEQELYSLGKEHEKDQDPRIKFLKSLRPQPKQEWSEEDEEMLKDIIAGLEATKQLTYKHEPSGWACYNRWIDWLKSLRPIPSWKPSEEQMTALNCAIADVARFSKRGGRQVEFENEPYYKALHSLYEQLKSL